MKTIAYLIPNAKHPNAVVAVGPHANGGWINEQQEVPAQLIPLVTRQAPEVVVAYVDANQSIVRIGKNANAGWISENIKPETQWQPLIPQPNLRTTDPS